MGLLSWTYAELEASGLNPDNLMCQCGHRGEEHHAVYWPSGITLDECEFYGFYDTDHCRQFREVGNQ